MLVSSIIARVAGDRQGARRLAALTAALFAAATLSAAAPAAHADSQCVAGQVCVWSAAWYTQSMQPYGAERAGQWIELPFAARSIKNRLGSRAVLTLQVWAGRVLGWDCLNPGNERRGDGSFWANWIVIGGIVSRC